MLFKESSIVYGNESRNISPEDALGKAKRYAQGDVYGIAKFNSVSLPLADIFDAFVKDMVKRNIEVEFLLTPYHPYVYGVIDKDYSAVIETEKFVRKYAEKNSIRLYGSFDPQKLSLGDECFRDGMHCRPSAIEHIITNDD